MRSNQLSYLAFFLDILLTFFLTISLTFFLTTLLTTLPETGINPPEKMVQR